MPKASWLSRALRLAEFIVLWQQLTDCERRVVWWYPMNKTKPDYNISTRERAQKTLDVVMAELSQPDPPEYANDLVDILDEIAIRYPGLRPTPQTQAETRTKSSPGSTSFLLEAVVTFAIFGFLCWLAYYLGGSDPLLTLLAFGALFWLIEWLLKPRSKRHK